MAGNDRTTVSTKGGRLTVRTLGGLMATLAVAWGGFAQAQDPATTLTAVEEQALGGDALQVRLRTSGPAPTPLTFTIDQPGRLSVDLPDVGLSLEQRRIDVNAGGVESIVAAAAGGIAYGADESERPFLRCLPALGIQRGRVVTGDQRGDGASTRDDPSLARRVNAKPYGQFPDFRNACERG